MGIDYRPTFKVFNRLIFISILLLSLLNKTGMAQEKIDVQLLVENSLNAARLISVSQLSGAISSDERFITLYISNITAERQENLFLHINVQTTRYGNIISLDERRGFAMEPGQTGRANASELRNGIPGITSVLSFNAGLTPNGEALINGLRGSSVLPDDIYTITVEVYQNGNSETGQLIGGNSIIIGADPALTTYEVRPVQPGDALGSGATIMTSNPVFNWTGDPSLNYRLLVVQASENQNAESLLQAALDTSPALQGGRLLENEMADVITDQQSFTYPPSGVKPLEQNNTYYWQVFAIVPDTRGEQLLPSEIFEFTISDEMNGIPPEIASEINALVRKYFRSNDILTLSREGFDLVSIELNGTVYSGPQIIQVLDDFFEKVEDGKIRLVE